jgi:hypothetical protein
MEEINIIVREVNMEDLPVEIPGLSEIALRFTYAAKSPAAKNSPTNWILR